MKPIYLIALAAAAYFLLVKKDNSASVLPTEAQSTPLPQVSYAQVENIPDNSVQYTEGLSLAQLAGGSADVYNKLMAIYGLQSIPHENTGAGYV